MSETAQETQPRRDEEHGRATSTLRTALAWALWMLINAEERRLRAGWRMLAHLLLLGLTGGAAVAGLGLALSLARRLAPGLEVSQVRSLGSTTPFAALAFALLGALTTTLTVWVARRLFDRRSFVSLGLTLDRRTVSELSLGFVLAGAMQGLVFAWLWSAGWLRVMGLGCQTEPLATTLASALLLALIFALVAWYEELLARGYWLQNMADGLNRPLAVLISSSVFALGHVGNPNATWVATAGIIGPGLLLAWAYVRAGRLWLPMGLHLGWNFFEGYVFGLPVSGMSTATLVRTKVAGPALWTGGDFGPEAGLVAWPALIAGAVAIGLVTRRSASRPAD
jgi:membrane protease YdiL (CAAX protease family)